ncbi:hypothetical protein PGB90_009620 [Kerria lacca]
MFKKESNKRVLNGSEFTKKIKKRNIDSETVNEENSDTEDEIQIDFSGFELAPCDFTGIRLLLTQLFLKMHLDISEMTSFLIEQIDIGSVVKVRNESEIDENPQNNFDENEDDTVYAVISVVSLTSNEEVRFVNQLKNNLIELSESYATEKTKEYIQTIFDDDNNSIGFIINERYLNLPPVISVQSFSKLKNEIDVYSEKNPKFNFTHYIMICKLYKAPVNKKKSTSDQNCEVIWCNTEEEIFNKEADSRFEYCVSDECDSGLSGFWMEDDIRMLPFRRVLIFSSHKLDEIINKLSTYKQ